MKIKGICVIGILVVSIISISSCTAVTQKSSSRVPSKEIQETAALTTVLETTTPTTIASVATISIGNTISTENKEITINKIEFSYDILPDDISGMYTHYAADSGEVYIHVDMDVKNLQKQNLKCDDILKVTADYNDGYTYKGQVVPEDPTLGFTYANITSIEPLTTLGVRVLIKCPQEVADTDKPLLITFTVDGQDFQYQMR